MINLTPKNWLSLFESLKKTRQTFQEVETKKKRYLIWNKEKFYNDPNPVRLNLQDLGIMQAAKKEIIKNLAGQHLPPNLNKDFFIGVNKPFQYFYTYTADAIFGGNGPKFEQERRPATFEGEALQIDLNAAYLTAVKNRGLLSEKTYKKFFEEETNEKRLLKKKDSSRHRGHNGEILKYSKDCRLITVGTLAQDKKIIPYIKGVAGQQIRDYSELHANVFFTAAADVGRLMCDILQQTNGFFYWVDAILIRPEAEQKAIELIKAAGYNFHKKRMILKQEGGKFESIDTETGEIKNYFVPNGRTLDNLLLFNSEQFAADIMQEYKTIIEKAGPVRKEEARKKISFVLQNHYNINSNIDFMYLTDQAQKIGLNLGEILKIQDIIQEDTRDPIFDEVIQTIIIEKIRKVTEEAPRPAPFQEMPDGGTIERTFFDYPA